MDRNTSIGLGLMMGLVLIYMTFFAPDPAEQAKQEKQKIVEQVKEKVEKQQVIAEVQDSTVAKANASKYGRLGVGAFGKKENVVIENELVKITISTLGANIKSVELKNYKNFDKSPLIIADSLSARFSYKIPTKSGIIDASKLYYNIDTKSANKLILKVKASPTEFVAHEFSLSPNSYEVAYAFKSVFVDGFVKNENASFSFDGYAKRTEKDLSQSRISSSVNYFTENEGHDDLGDASLDEEKESIEKVKWVSFKSRFFNIGIIPSQAFAKGEIKQSVDEKDTVGIKNQSASLLVAGKDAQNFQAKLYFGPNDLAILNEVTDSYGENVAMGWPVIRQINKFLIYPVFKLVQKVTGNYGIVILLLVIILKLVLLPLSYKSYLSMAKMRALKPEIDEIKEKYGDDMTKSQQENMKLYQQVGVNPLSGCVPMLLSAPFLIAMFSFFPNLIDLRQQSFLWAHDLSTFDSVYSLPFSLPGYGNHVSLFTILMTLSTLAYTWMNNQISTVQGPMKAMSYIMPIMFTFVLNSYAAGLTYYYLVSNCVTMLQQVGIKYFVDEDKIRAKLDENKRKFEKGEGPAKKSSGFMNRLQEAMKAQEELKKAQTGKK